MPGVCKRKGAAESGCSSHWAVIRPQHGSRGFRPAVFSLLLDASQLPGFPTSGMKPFFLGFFSPLPFNGFAVNQKEVP
jgi:hypothetical protein